MEITSEERKQSVEFALEMLKKTLVETKTSLAFTRKGNLIFFGTEDYVNNGNEINGIQQFRVNVNDLVK